MNKDKLRETLRKHKQWLDGVDGGNPADLQDAYLLGANLQDANLQDANLQDTYLQDAYLLGAYLQSADLRRANLQDANLQDANLQDANLQDTYLRGANLQDADLRGADLRGANLDYSCWPLWCGSFDVKVDARIARQLAYHFCRLDCDNPEYQAAREAMKDFANQFHLAKECGEIHGEQTKEAGTPASE